jgi:hypothetical protein
MAKKHNPNPAGKAGRPVSLYPLSFTEAINTLGQVKMPEAGSKKPKPNNKEIQKNNE